MNIKIEPHRYGDYIVATWSLSDARKLAKELEGLSSPLVQEMLLQLNKRLDEAYNKKAI